MFTLLEHAHTSRGSGNIYEVFVVLGTFGNMQSRLSRQSTEPQTMFAFSELSRLKHEISFIPLTLTPLTGSATLMVMNTMN